MEWSREPCFVENRSAKLARGHEGGKLTVALPRIIKEKEPKSGALTEPSNARTNLSDKMSANSRIRFGGIKTWPRKYCS